MLRSPPPRSSWHFPSFKRHILTRLSSKAGNGERCRPTFSSREGGTAPRRPPPLCHCARLRCERTSFLPLNKLGVLPAEGHGLGVSSEPCWPCHMSQGRGGGLTGGRDACGLPAASRGQLPGSGRAGLPAAGAEEFRGEVRGVKGAAGSSVRGQVGQGLGAGGRHEEVRMCSVYS